MERFFLALRKSLESNPIVQKGQCFLQRRRLVNDVFPPIARQTGKRLNLRVHKEICNAFPPDWNIGHRQMVDYVYGDVNDPEYFFEVESLDRAQLYLFLPHGDRSDDSKLWYYWGTVCKRLSGDVGMPRYFVWLLILPDQPVSTMPFWDASKYYGLFSPHLREIVQDSPFRFYDQLIKTSAKLFLRRNDWMKIGNTRDGWRRARLVDYQHACELVIITCTGQQLLMSRGSDEFDPSKEKRISLK
jgi:hypothetical protein